MKEKTCPECGGTFRGAGLSGHLRFKHGISEKRIKRIHKREDVLDDLFSLFDELIEIKKRRSVLSEIDGSGILHSHTVSRKLQKMLRNKEQDIKGRIADIGTELSENEHLLPS